MDKKVGLILINYQDYARQYLSACRASLLRQDYPQELTSFYIVDNAATLQSAEYLGLSFPEARVLARPDGNYAAANNLGCQQAIADGCEFLVSVNMDTEMEPGWLSELIKGLTSDPQIGLAQSKILLYPAKQEGVEEKSQDIRINSLGNVINFLGFGYTSGYNEPDRELSGYPEIRGYASGCSLAIKKEVFLRVGGYNEEYYMYHDDLELGLKVRLAGYRIILAPHSIIYHKYQFARSIKMVYYMERNRYLTLGIFYPLRLLLLIALPGLIMDFGLLFFSLIKGWFREEWRAYAYFCRWSNYAKIIEERRKIKVWQAVPFSKLAADFSGRIEFQEIANPLLKYLVNPAFNLYWRLIKKLI